jgi:hypothetical protein
MKTKRKKKLGPKSPQWKKTGDWPGKHDNQILYKPNGDYYLLESDGEGEKCYLRLYAADYPGDTTREATTIGVFSSEAEAKAAAKKKRK